MEVKRRPTRMFALPYHEEEMPFTVPSFSNGGFICFMRWKSTKETAEKLRKYNPLVGLLAVIDGR